jgi:hypothetical protein
MEFNEWCRLMDSTLFKVIITLLIITSVLSTQILSISANAQSLQSISYRIIYDPLDNTGILSINSSIYASDCLYIEIPVGIFGDIDTVYSFINYSTSPELYLLGSNFNEYSRVFEAYACGSGAIELVFVIDNALEEDGLFHYVGLINTSSLYQYAGLLELNITLTDQYSIDIYDLTGSLYVIVDSETSSIYARGFGLAYIIIEAEVLEVNTTTPTPITTPTPTQTQTIPSTTSTYTTTKATTTPTQALTSTTETKTYSYSPTSAETHIATPTRSTISEISTQTTEITGRLSELIIIGVLFGVAIVVLTWLLLTRRK